ncbi:MAG: alpha-hydroxy-acid oxidizing protein [Kordiimonadaceae bacterium]|nr:alpha-hydroxy-acid oxidizing protein [Kordiimonadaceae bacterium]
MLDYFNVKYAHTSDLKRKAKRRMPAFAFDYLEGGCMDEVSVNRNYRAIDDVQLRGNLLKPFDKSDLSVEIFGHTYSAPFGVAPIGLQGLMWPKTPEYLAKAAADKNIPFVLSTVSSASLENIAEISEGKAWFQLYNPTSDDMRADLLKRVESAAYPVLVVTVDVPAFGYRPRDIRNGLAMPPKMTLKNIIQMASRPRWLMETALAGKPEMQTLIPYMAKGGETEELAAFMNRAAMGGVDVEGLKPIRDMWKGPLVIKGLITEDDVATAIKLGADGVIISNHGGRQLDAGEAPVEPLKRIAAKYKGRIKIFMDSGVQSGSNIAGALACGAELTFLGRSFVYGVGALGGKGAYHTINCLYRQLDQIMNQLKCQSVSDLPNHLVEAIS